MSTKGKTMCVPYDDTRHKVYQRYNQDTCYRLIELYPAPKKEEETLEYHNEVRDTYATKREVRWNAKL